MNDALGIVFSYSDRENLDPTGYRSRDGQGSVVRVVTSRYVQMKSLSFFFMLYGEFDSFFSVIYNIRNDKIASSCLSRGDDFVIPLHIIP